MEELRLVGFEDGSILLENLQGNNYRLPVDEQLKSAVRAATQHANTAQSISPREIQDRIRLGATVEELVAISGAEPEYINKFAQPVFDELAHMVETALAIRITIAGDRFNDDVQVPFGQLVEQRLVAAGATKLRWSSKRGEGISWMLSCNYTLNGHEGLALWLYEPRKYQLSPENETAVTLSNHNNTIDGPIPKLRTIEGAAPATSSSTRIAEAPAAFRKDEEKPVIAEPATTTNLLDELRKRREEAAKVAEPMVEVIDSETEEQPEPTVIEIVQTETEVDDTFEESTDDFIDEVPEVQITEDAHSEEEPNREETEQEKSSRRSRPSMPSWDEIVFGTKSDE